MSAGCTFCGGVGRDRSSIGWRWRQYCVDLWAKYEHLLQLIAEGAPLSEGGDS
jgi:hypothetical protein